jgi:NADH-quinone oxidoreductase subunit L
MADGPAILEFALMGISVSVAGIAAWFAYDFYILHPERPKQIAAWFGKVYEVVANKYFVDEIYEAWLIRPLVEGSKALWAYVDVNFIDRTTYFVSDLVTGAGAMLRSVQNGRTQQYALYIAMGLTLTIFWVLKG